MHKTVGLVAAGALVGVMISALGTMSIGAGSTPGPERTRTEVDSRAARAMPPDPPPAMTYVPPGDNGNGPKGENEGKTANGTCSVDPSYHDKDTTGMNSAAAQAWTKAKEEAGSRGVTLCAHEAKRTAAQQKAEFDEALERYNGDRRLAEQYVLPPAKSLHVSGLAVDVQPRASAAWLERTAGALGWCRRYANEPWHFEYNRDYADSGCPALKPHP
ncbi:D-alanyl-D-alanine carboxypeptidase family protein [Allokutzneria sp. A3M-2-11 16]|uniref:D-alanyl-D-alanine carboxypeptidase family protein n=1 Tax=Allokutzneria sp. A3M-2-11 16 TaxID=2962043 RepID=UPI0020B642A1|nr:D-alanyl-D-alanine carboxypeptidase family protein [Allokutzneria sp. A3M-2-11 16]MCP3799056.1 D-alanyl-D-alanine carboxypeptidase family protein [Allokutzneria sp. A3M-2-11 16]